MSFFKNKRCYCHRLTGGHQPGWFERLLLKLLPHCDIIKAVGDCRRCYNTGFSGWGSGYDAVCSECGGQSVHAQTVLYLRRFYIWRSKWIGKNSGDLYLHHIVRSDDDADPHDHPWGFTGLVLAGGYLDESYTWSPRTGRLGPGYERVRPFSFIDREAEHAHRVIIPSGDKTAWTLIFTTGYAREWSFITKDGPVPWREYLGVNEGIEDGE